MRLLLKALNERRFISHSSTRFLTSSPWTRVCKVGFFKAHMMTINGIREPMGNAFIFAATLELDKNSDQRALELAR